MIGEKETTEHGVTLVDAPLLLDEGFGLEEGSNFYLNFDS
jgi:hypothetical protein